MSRHSKDKTRPRVWTNRTRGGVLRAQCKPCFDAGLQPQVTIPICPNCLARYDRRSDELETIPADVLRESWERQRRLNRERGRGNGTPKAS